VGLVLVFVGGRAEALGIGLMTCAAVTVAAFAATEAKHLGDATPDHAEPHPGPDPDLSRAPASPGPVALDVTGRLMGGDEKALLEYVAELRELSAEQRLVEVLLPPPPPGHNADPHLLKAAEMYEVCATAFVRGGVRFPWGPPNDASVARALQALWNSFGREADVVVWFTWPPGHPEQRVACPVPNVDRRLTRADATDGQPLHIQAVPHDLVWERFAPLVLRAALEAGSGLGGLPVLLDDWRVADIDPSVAGVLGTMTPHVEGALASSEDTTDAFW
jgi:hypothetical protein